MRNKNAVTVAMDELESTNEAICMLESRGCPDRLAPYCIMEGRDRMQGELVTASAKLRGKKRQLTSSSDHLKRPFCMVQAAENEVQHGQLCYHSI